jgi:hypothetical protein
MDSVMDCYIDDFIVQADPQIMATQTFPTIPRTLVDALRSAKTYEEWKASMIAIGVEFIDGVPQETTRMVEGFDQPRTFLDWLPVDLRLLKKAEEEGNWNLVAKLLKPRPGLHEGKCQDRGDEKGLALLQRLSDKL